MKKILKKREREREHRKSHFILNEFSNKRNIHNETYVINSMRLVISVLLCKYGFPCVETVDEATSKVC